MPCPGVELALGVMERELSHGGEYLLGPELTLADFFVLPSTFAFSLTEEGKAMYPRYPAFYRWRERMENLPTTQKLRGLPPREPILHAREVGEFASSKILSLQKPNGPKACVQRPANQVLVPLFDLATAVDDDRHFLAVFSSP